MKSKLAHWLLAFVLACSTWLSVGTSAHAAPITQTDSSATNSFLILFPELQAMAAPKWLKEGMRVTYTSASGIIGAKRVGRAVALFNMIRTYAKD